jgi:hypothetical protein
MHKQGFLAIFTSEYLLTLLFSVQSHSRCIPNP